MNRPLSLAEVTEKLNNLTPDNEIRVKYFSTPKCLKAFSDHKVIKTTQINGKVGLDYVMLESVQKRTADSNYVPKQRNTDTTWVIEKKLQHNNKTGNNLVFFYPSVDTQSTTTITHIEPNGTESVINYDQMREFCGSAGQPKKQLDENGNPVRTEVMYINANNIYSIEII